MYTVDRNVDHMIDTVIRIKSVRITRFYLLEARMPSERNENKTTQDAVSMMYRVI